MHGCRRPELVGEAAAYLAGLGCGAVKPLNQPPVGSVQPNPEAELMRWCNIVS